MKLCYVFLLCMLIVTGVSAQGDKLLQTVYTPSFPEGTIETYLADIQLKSSIPISFSASSVDVKTHVRMNGNEQTVGDALNTILTNHKVSIISRKDKILIVSRDVRKKYLRQETYSINGFISFLSIKINSNMRPDICIL